MNNKHYVGKRVSTHELYDELGPITGVALLLDEENEILSGDDTGYMLEIDCKYGSQEMADNILSAIRNKTYKGYRSTCALLNPIAELGDGITVDGSYSLLAYRSINFGPGHMSEIAAPGESTLEREYQYKSPTQRRTNRQLAQTRSMITKTAEEIRLQIQGEMKNVDSKIDNLNGVIQALETTFNGEISDLKADVVKLDSSIALTASSIRAEVSAEVEGLEVDITNLNGEISTIQADVVKLDSSITQTAAQIRTDVNSQIETMGNDIESEMVSLRSSITQTATEIRAEIQGLDSKYSTISQTVEGLTVTTDAGETKIKGGSIETGTLYVNAANIRGTLTADQVVLTGAITWDTLDSGTQSKITSAETNASNAYDTAAGASWAAYQIANGAYQGGSFINGKDIYSPNLYGDNITLLDGSSRRVGVMSLQQANTYAFDITSDLSLRMQAASGYNTYLAVENGPSLLLHGGSDGYGARCQFGGGPLVVDGHTWGYSLPANAVDGQVFFLLAR